MRTLILLRHAKSSWKDPTLPDHERPLNSRGKADAPLMGKALAKHGVTPDHVLCSSARRTRDTLALVLPELKSTPQVDYVDGLYHGTPQALLEILKGAPATAGTLLLVSHNPEIHELALDLIGSGPMHLRDRLAAKYPTAGVVVIRFPAGDWKDIQINSGKLELFLTPRDEQHS